MGYDVVLLEGARIGFGASGRNGGQLVNSYSRDIDVIEKNLRPGCRENARQHDV
ncbi:oxidoreductase [Klebsiella michiganensis]|uniref:Oxidoreductase n=1 Tax=Klebsiella michiganensis TaxID=1134687 RepID=A0A7H4N1U1_9ENTR|nr:oxidoreductase [Klebsiella michiganensis]